MFGQVLWWGDADPGEIFPQGSEGGEGDGGEGDGGEGGESGGGGGEKMLTLTECLSLFAVTEQLGTDDAWRCPRCKDFKEATKKMDLWAPPAVLCIHLKRFSVDASSFWVRVGRRGRVLCPSLYFTYSFLQSR